MNIQKDFKENVLKGEFGICELGSCQYSIIHNMMEFIKRHRNQYSTLAGLLNQIDIKLSDFTIRKFDDIRYRLIDPQVIKDEHADFISLTCECHKIIDICKAGTHDDLFTLYRKCAWDLWTTAETLTVNTFNGLDIETPMRPDTHGPSMNQEAQSSGIINGIQCYLFLEYKLIKDIECLKDFDT